MKIVLVGYMGSGKTTIGKLLAKQLKVKFLDLDDYIETAEEQTIDILFKDKGEIYFRKKEFQYLEEVLSFNESFVLSTGGGTPCYGNNMANVIKATPNTFYIKVSIAELVARLSTQKDTRPLIQRLSYEELPEFIGKHLFERSFYYNMARNKVSGDGKAPQVLVDEIKAQLV